GVLNDEESSMQIQVYSDNRIENSSKLVEWASGAAQAKLQRFDQELTRVTLHITDENGEKAGAQDKRCQIEARARGLQPISVTHKSDTIRIAVDGALDKLHAALTSQLGKLRDRRAATTAADPGEGARQEALMDEDYGGEPEYDQKPSPAHPSAGMGAPTSWPGAAALACSLGQFDSEECKMANIIITGANRGIGLALVKTYLLGGDR